jgi:hypothetical protein
VAKKKPELVAYVDTVDLEYVKNATHHLEGATLALAKAQEIYAFVKANLHQRYDLKDGDAIQADGKIVRAPAKKVPPMPNPPPQD